ncbi:hypothetical protein V502_04038 [Pseudogymnoascus sp. VKM F-4520 (FW-2644)]|nr:hypothetical protein V502_04038 [Pseudogymnoascus sp. VKM F-4520 (FW-2644)]
MCSFRPGQLHLRGACNGMTEFGRDGDGGGKVDVLDSRKKRIIRNDDCHHAVGVVAGPYGRAVSAATLPKHTEPEYMRIMKIKPEEVQTFRGATKQPNIAYSVHDYADESDETDAICQLVGGKLEQYTAPAKIIV